MQADSVWSPARELLENARAHVDGAVFFEGGHGAEVYGVFWVVMLGFYGWGGWSGMGGVVLMGFAG